LRNGERGNTKNVYSEVKDYSKPRGRRLDYYEIEDKELQSRSNEKIINNAMFIPKYSIAKCD
jgi:hypothetical protein